MEAGHREQEEEGGIGLHLNPFAWNSVVEGVYGPREKDAYGDDEDDDPRDSLKVLQTGDDLSVGLVGVNQ